MTRSDLQTSKTLHLHSPTALTIPPSTPSSSARIHLSHNSNPAPKRKHPANHPLLTRTYNAPESPPPPTPRPRPRPPCCIPRHRAPSPPIPPPLPHPDPPAHKPRLPFPPQIPKDSGDARKQSLQHLHSHRARPVHIKGGVTDSSMIIKSTELPSVFLHLSDNGPIRV